MTPQWGSLPLGRFGVGRKEEAGGSGRKVKAVAERNKLKAERASGPACSAAVYPLAF